MELIITVNAWKQSCLLVINWWIDFFFKDNLYTEIPLSNTEKQNANADYKMDSAQKHDAKCKKPDTKSHMLYAFKETLC